VRSARLAGAGAVLAGPTVLAFWSGGYFDQPRLWAALGACALLALAAVVAPLPRHRATWLAVGALAALAAWTWLSAGWAPLEGEAIDDAQRVALYAVGLLAAVMLLGALPRAVEPALALGTLVVTGYGLAGRLLPGIVHEAASRSALGRLEQPLTYWNASGALAGLGMVLCVRLAGDPSRRPGMRAAALAATVPLGLGVALSFSRGALVALAVALGVLIVLAPTRAQRRAIALAVGLALVAALVGAELGGVRALVGTLGRREAEGAVMLALLAALMGAAALLALRPPPVGDLGRPPLRVVAVGAVLVLAAGAVAASGGRPSQRTPAAGATAARLASADSNRYGYWRVALGSWSAHPLAGVGASGFRVEWRRERTVADPARDAHSLPLETLAELGLVGFALLAAWAAGIAHAASAAWRAAPAAAAGPAAALVLWAVHACLDWDWEMPALTLVALALAAALLAQAEALSAPAVPAGSGSGTHARRARRAPDRPPEPSD
jgi:O-Antigen ligase